MDRIDLAVLTNEKQHLLSEINEYFKHNRLGYIKVPTGWGKTFLAKHLMKQYYEQGKSILFLVSRNNQLLNQTIYSDPKGKMLLFPNSCVLSSEHERIDTADFLRSREIRRSSGNHGEVIFASLQTVLSKRNEEIKKVLSKTADLVVIDEIHNFISNRGNDFINEIDEQVRVLGMTATPFQGIVGHVKFVDDIAGDMREIFSKTLPQCIVEGQLSELEYTIIRSNESILDIFDFPNGLKSLEKEELYMDCGSLEKVNALIRRTQLATRIYKEKIANDNSKTLVFCAPVKNVIRGFGENQKKVLALHAKVCSAIFNGELKDKIDESFSFNNYTQASQFKDAVYLSSDLPKKERADILREFRATDRPPFVLCTVGMLIEGFDFPDLENLILLRPTLSMRLFEQQIGRVVRSPLKESNKTKGSIFEITDDIDSLYDNYKELVFEGNCLDRIQMLQPENRIDELFTEGNTTGAFKTGKINISEINLGGAVGKFDANSVEIPPTSLRAKYFCKLLSMIEKKTKGHLNREKLALMQMAQRFRPHNVDSTREIVKLVEFLERLEHEADVDPQLGVNCRKYKTKLFKEVRWLLLLVALTHLKHSDTSVDSKEKSDILSILGFGRDCTQIDDFRMLCLEKGCGIETLGTLKKRVQPVASAKEFSRQCGKPLQQSNLRNYLSYVYWASCFAMDLPKIRQLLFESREWSYQAKKFII